MGGLEGIIRVNVSVPKKLKERMDAEKSAANWSAVATQAFEAKLLELASQKEPESMDELIKRLKAAEELDRNENYQLGRDAGETWVKERARPRHLRALQKAFDGSDDMHDLELMLEVFTNTPDDLFMNHQIAYGLLEAIEPHRSRGISDVAGFWYNSIEEDGLEVIENPFFARGFVEAALELWEQVEDKV